MKELTLEEQILIYMYIEHRNGATNLGNITFNKLGVSKEEFNEVLSMMDSKNYLLNFHPSRGGGKILIPWLEKNVILSDCANSKAKELIDSIELKESDSIIKNVFTEFKEDVKDIIARYLADMCMK